MAHITKPIAKRLICQIVNWNALLMGISCPDYFIGNRKLGLSKNSLPNCEKPNQSSTIKIKIIQGAIRFAKARLHRNTLGMLPG